MNHIIIYQNPKPAGPEFETPAPKPKPCPHCGSMGIFELQLPNGLIAMCCRACHAIGPAKPTIQEAWYWWSHRA